jgi:hypothetical protein
MPGVLRRYLEILDGPESERALGMLAEDVRFSILFSTADGHAREFAGGRREFDAYMAQRGVVDWNHHVVAEFGGAGVELVLGETRRGGAVVATFVAAIQLDEAGRISRYVVGRSPAVTLAA